MATSRTLTFGKVPKDTTFIAKGVLYLKTSKAQGKPIMAGDALSVSRKFEDDEVVERTLKIEYRGYAGGTGRLRL